MLYQHISTVTMSPHNVFLTLTYTTRQIMRRRRIRSLKNIFADVHIKLAFEPSYQNTDNSYWHLVSMGIIWPSLRHQQGHGGPASHCSIQKLHKCWEIRRRSTDAHAEIHREVPQRKTSLISRKVTARFHTNKSYLTRCQHRQFLTLSHLSVLSLQSIYLILQFELF